MLKLFTRHEIKFLNLFHENMTHYKFRKLDFKIHLKLSLLSMVKKTSFLDRVSGVNWGKSLSSDSSFFASGRCRHHFLSELKL